MSFIVVLVSSVIAFILVRLFLYLVTVLLMKVLKAEVSNKLYIPLSVFYLLFYLQCFIGAVYGVSTTSVLELYLIYTFIGVACVMWCYFKWDIKFLSVPKFNSNSKEVALKKLIVFSVVFVISLYYGYSQLLKTLNNIEVNLSIVLANITIVPGMIAFDRVMSQLVSLFKRSE